MPRSASPARAQGTVINNERLEYLGDAVLDAIVAHHLFTRFPDADEGLMTKLRARIVKRKSLDQLAARINLPVLIAPGILPGNKSKHLYGNALEALVGAIYLDRGYRYARRFFVRRILRKHIDLAQLLSRDTDYKSRIIEWAQKNRIEVRFESSEEHTARLKDPAFVSTIYLNGVKIASGRGGAKKEAEQQAAKGALSTIHLN
jgi:ribonuclease-3